MHPNTPYIVGLALIVAVLYVAVIYIPGRIKTDGARNHRTFEVSHALLAELCATLDAYVDHPIHETRGASQLHMLERLIQHRNILVRHSNNGEMSLFKTINSFDVTFKRLIDATRQVHTIADIGDAADVSDAEEHLERAFHLFVEPFPIPDGMTARPSLRLVTTTPTKETPTL